MTQNNTHSQAETTISQNDFYVRKDCRLCGSSNLVLAMPMRPTPISDAYIPENLLNQEQKSYGLDLYLCQQCGLVQIRETVNPESIYRQYLYETTTSPGLVEHYDRYAASIIKQLSLSEESFVVEIGSNDGTLLQFFKNRGMKVLGIDPAIEISRKATKNGVKTIPDFFNCELAERIRKEYGPASLMIANMVLANMDDVSETLQGVAVLLADGGSFVFETGYLGSLVENLVFDNIYHEHLCYFSLKPLISFFKNHGMDMVHAEWVSTKGGSIRCFVQSRASRRQLSESVNVLLQKEQELKLDAIETYRNFSFALQSNKRQLLRFLNELKGQGKRIAGYGASNSATTFIYYYEIGNYLEYLIDDNPKKQASYSPGLHLPVFSSGELYHRKPDYVVILAWRFAKLMMARNYQYFRNGGQFIVPLPKVQIFDSEA